MRILLDSCSQKSYERTLLRNKLCLSLVGTERVLIKTFGNIKASLQKCDIVQFALESQDNVTLFISTYKSDLICGPTANQTIEAAQQYYPQL